MNIQELEDRILLRELIDRVSILGDKKDFNSQVQLFSEDAVSETFAGGKAILKLNGRKEIAEAFEGFLKDMDVVYHFNGQQVLNVEGNRASGTCYCTVTLIKNENGKKMMTNIGAVYQDDYVRLNNHWFIAKRIGNFNWQEIREVGQ